MVEEPTIGMTGNLDNRNIGVVDLPCAGFELVQIILPFLYGLTMHDNK